MAIDAAVAMVDAASFELRRIHLIARNAGAFGRRMLFATGTETFAVGGARLHAPIKAIRVEADDLAARNADLASHRAGAHAAGHAIARAAARARDGRKGVVDQPVAVIVDAVANFGRRDAQAGGSLRRSGDRQSSVHRGLGDRNPDRAARVVGRFYDPVGVESRASAPQDTHGRPHEAPRDA
jgi:hypothetical protein